jgi:hypothetical protein
VSSDPGLRVKEAEGREGLRFDFPGVRRPEIISAIDLRRATSSDPWLRVKAVEGRAGLRFDFPESRVPKENLDH